MPVEPLGLLVTGGPARCPQRGRHHRSHRAHGRRARLRRRPRRGRRGRRSRGRRCRGGTGRRRQRAGRPRRFGVTGPSTTKLAGRRRVPARRRFGRGRGLLTAVGWAAATRGWTQFAHHRPRDLTEALHGPVAGAG
ncbi:hypothetical protein F0Q45_25270, partial [Mycobacterium simiae]